jgi:hypothetical protein
MFKEWIQYYRNAPNFSQQAPHDSYFINVHCITKPKGTALKIDIFLKIKYKRKRKIL